jgi:hypothetical protein
MQAGRPTASHNQWPQDANRRPALRPGCCQTTAAACSPALALHRRCCRCALLPRRCCTGAAAQALLHRRCCPGAVAQALLHRRCCTGVAPQALLHRRSCRCALLHSPEAHCSWPAASWRPATASALQGRAPSSSGGCWPPVRELAGCSGWLHIAAAGWLQRLAAHCSGWLHIAVAGCTLH